MSGKADEAREKPYKHLKYLPHHLGAIGGWKPIKIGNLGAALRAGKGSTSGKLDPLSAEAVAAASRESSEVPTWGSEWGA